MLKIAEEYGPYLLADILGDRHSEYRSAWWLKSDFEAPIWECEFGPDHISLNFQINIDGYDLTSPIHSHLLEVCKSWLCIQTHPDITGGISHAPRSAYNLVTRALREIDYFLLNSANLNLVQMGLAGVTESDLYKFLFDIGSNRTALEGIYHWTETLREFLLSHSQTLTPAEIENAIEKRPELAQIEPDDDVMQLMLSDEELVAARVFLWKEEFYCYSTGSNYRFTPNTSKLASAIYRNTLWGKFINKTIPNTLCIAPIDRYDIEMPRACVRTAIEERCSESRLRTYWQTLRSMGILESIGLKVPAKALAGISFEQVMQSLELKSPGRYQTLPIEVCTHALKHGIEYYLEHGEHLINSYLMVVERAVHDNVSCAEIIRRYGIASLADERTHSMGVMTWHLTENVALREANPGSSDKPRISRAEFFSRLRSNEGLIEQLRVLYASIFVAVGILMARRQGELLKVNAGSCLDKSGQYFIFENEKSGVAGNRQKEFRPIPEIASRMIRHLESVQNKLRSLGLLSEPTRLFSYPDRTGLTLVDSSPTNINRILDGFCDYFKVASNPEGKRYYIRQHQLRRFFAMAFFWGNSFGGMDTLRWFLGHTDLEHLYHYITESVSGAVLRSVKAQYAGDQIRRSSPDANSLAELASRHFGTNRYSVLDAIELDEFIEELIEEGRVTIEPEFFQALDGENYRILIKVVAGDNNDDNR